LGNPTTWLWNFGDGTTDTVQSPSYIYQAAGTYDVSLIVSDGLISDTLIQANYISVVQPLQANFSVNSTWTMEYDMLYFTDMSTGNPNSWEWDFDDDGIIDSYDQNPSWYYTGPGVYTVSLVVSNGVVSDTFVQVDLIYVEMVYVPTEADFSANQTTVMVGESIQFNDLSVGPPYSWSWDFDNDGVYDSYVQNPIWTYNLPGSYTISLLVDGMGGFDSEIKNAYITVVQPLQANFTASDTAITIGDTIQFIDNSIGNLTNRLWDFGDGNTDTAQTPEHIYQTAGTYSVSLVVSDGASSDTLVRNNYIAVNQPLQANFIASDTTISLGETIQFTDLSTGNPINWFWDFGDGTSDTLQNPWHVYQTASNYNVMLVVENDMQEVDTLIMAITIVVPGTSIISPYDIAGAPSDNGIIMGLNLENTVSVSQIQFKVVNDNHPEIFFDQGNSYYFTPRNSGYFGGSYSYNGFYMMNFSPALPPGSGSIFNCVINIAATTLPGNYPLYLTDLLLLGSTGDTIPLQSGFGIVSVTGQEVLNADFFSINTNGTTPFQVQFNDLSTGNPTTWNWDFGDGTNDTIQNPLHVYQSGGSYSVSLQVSNDTVIDTLVYENYINVLGPVSFLFSSSDTTITIGDTVSFTDLSQGNPTAWLWDFGDGSNTTQQHPTHIYQTPGIFTVSLIISDGANSDTLEISDYITVDAIDSIFTCVTSIDQ